MPYEAADVLLVEVPNQTGAFGKICERLAADHLNIDYAYCSFNASAAARGTKARRAGGHQGERSGQGAAGLGRERRRDASPGAAEDARSPAGVRAVAEMKPAIWVPLLACPAVFVCSRRPSRNRHSGQASSGAHQADNRNLALPSGQVPATLRRLSPPEIMGGGSSSRLSSPPQNSLPPTWPSAASFQPC